jgi:acyl-CoA hydrolase
MTLVLDPADIELSRFIRPGDRILIAEGSGEPQTLTEALVRQRHDLGGVEVFVGLGLSSTFTSDRVDGLTMSSYGALGSTRRLADAGLLNIVPVGLGDIASLLERGGMRFDVVLTSVAPEIEGRHPLGLMALHAPAAIRHARTVLAEVNAQMPQTPGASIQASRVAGLVHSDRALLVSPGTAPDDITQAIAGHVAGVVADGATLQLGVGAIPDAVCAQLRHHRDLGIHSGMLSDGLVDLIRRGVVTNRLKTQQTGVSTIGAVLGSEDSYRFAHRNPDIRLEGVEITHLQADREPRLVSINSALEVDIWGQVNAEVVGGRYIGAIGGQPMLCRAGGRSAQGAGVIALPSTATGRDGRRISRIRATPVERVTTSASDVDVVVTEFGVARLSGLGFAERRRALRAIAHPDFHDTL